MALIITGPAIGSTTMIQNVVYLDTDPNQIPLRWPAMALGLQPWPTGDTAQVPGSSRLPPRASIATRQAAARA